jgi:hypothetical protein
MDPFTLKMKALRLFETPRHAGRTKQRRTSKVRRLQQHRREKVESYSLYQIKNFPILPKRLMLHLEQKSQISSKFKFHLPLFTILLLEILTADL